MLEAAHEGLVVELVGIVTTGDVTKGSLADAGGKGLFTKEVELCLLRGGADFAVHSYKDVPTTMPLVDEADLVVAAVPPRADPADVLVGAYPLDAMAAGSRVGTGSPRRVALLRALRPDLIAVPIRGNVDTRLSLIDAGKVDAVVLAAAGLQRLGRLSPSGANSIDLHPLDLNRFVPAAGQGALALQCRRDDVVTRERLAAVNDPVTQRCVTAEREVIRLLDGDCHSPIAAHATPAAGGLTLNVVFEEGGHLLHATVANVDHAVARHAIDVARTGEADESFCPP